MSSPECDESENVIRAIRSSDWDERHNRWSSNLFTGPNTSVSRLEVLSLNKIFKIFCKELHKPPKHKVIKAGEISVGKIKKIGQNFVNNGKANQKNISVTPNAIKDLPGYIDNPAHALVNETPSKKHPKKPPKKLPRTLAFEIIKSLKLHDAPNCIFVKYRNLIVIIILVLVAAVIFL